MESIQLVIAVILLLTLCLAIWMYRSQLKKDASNEVADLRILKQKSQILNRDISQIRSNRTVPSKSQLQHFIDEKIFTNKEGLLTSLELIETYWSESGELLFHFFGKGKTDIYSAFSALNQLAIKNREREAVPCEWFGLEECEQANCFPVQSLFERLDSEIQLKLDDLES